MIATRFKEIYKAAFPGLAAARQRSIAESQRCRISKILGDSASPRHLDREDTFWELQGRYSPRDQYKYDSFNSWWRGETRAHQLLLAHEGMAEPGAMVLEAGCGDGMVGWALASYGHTVTLADSEDWRDKRVGTLPFVNADLCGRLPLPSSSYDFIYSYNTFEHLAKPDIALMELIRLCRTGGTINLDFGPLYAGPWGLHAYRTIYMPYSQFLFSPEFLQNKLEQLGIKDLGTKRSALQPLNRWRARQFDQLWRESGCEVISLTTNQETAHLYVVEEFPHAFSGLGLSFNDLIVSTLNVVLRKR